jgi:hypothetical protein
VAVEVNERGPAGEFGLLEEELFDCVFVVVVEVFILVEWVRGDSDLIFCVVVLENVGIGEVGVVGCCCE